MPADRLVMLVGEEPPSVTSASASSAPAPAPASSTTATTSAATRNQASTALPTAAVQPVASLPMADGDDAQPAPSSGKSSATVDAPAASSPASTEAEVVLRPVSPSQTRDLPVVTSNSAWLAWQLPSSHVTQLPAVAAEH